MSATEAPAEPYTYPPPVVVGIPVTVQAIAIREADGRYSITIPELPGCHSEADTLDDVAAQAAEAAAGWLAVVHDSRRDEAIRTMVGLE